MTSERWEWGWSGERGERRRWAVQWAGTGTGGKEGGKEMLFAGIAYLSVTSPIAHLPRPGFSGYREMETSP
jgi:hypothetical protein